MSEDGRTTRGKIVIGTDDSLEEIEAALFDDMVAHGIPVEQAAEAAPGIAAGAAVRRDLLKAQNALETARQETERVRHALAGLQRVLRHQSIMMMTLGCVALVETAVVVMAALTAHPSGH